MANLVPLRHRGGRYANAFLSRGWLGVVGLRSWVPRPVAHYRNAARFRPSSRSRRETIRRGTSHGSWYVFLHVFTRSPHIFSSPLARGIYSYVIFLIDEIIRRILAIYFEFLCHIGRFS